jgi:hypothetical protein
MGEEIERTYPRRLVLIEWIDSFSTSNGWITYEDTDETIRESREGSQEQDAYTTCGLFYHENDEFVYLVMSESRVNSQIQGLFGIPKVSIRRMVELRREDKKKTAKDKEEKSHGEK